MDISKDCNNVKQQLSDAFSLWGEAIEKYQNALHNLRNRFESISMELGGIESRCDAAISARVTKFVNKTIIRLQQIYSYIDKDGNDYAVETRFSRLLEEVDQFIKTLNKE